MDTFGNKLRKARESKGLQQKEVSATLKMPLSTYNGYEKGYRMPGIKTLIKIAEYYNVSIDYLLGIDNNTYLDKSILLSQIKEIKDKINILEEYIENSK